MSNSDSTIHERVEYFKECIYVAYIELNTSTEYTFNLLKKLAVNEAIDDIRTEPLNLGCHDFEMIMSLAEKDISFNEYTCFKNNWD